MLTNTEVKEVPLKDMDFPLDFKVCFEPSRFNETLLKSFGYESMTWYIRGANNHTLPALGWGGYDNQSVQVKNASEVLHTAKKDWTTSHVLNKLHIYPLPGNDQNINATLQKINWIDNCYLLNRCMTEKDVLRTMKSLLIFFDESMLKDDNVTIELKLQGQNLAASRAIQDHLFFHTGDDMTMKPGKIPNFRVKIKKRVHIEGEPGNTCRNYPNSDFGSYRECDHKFMKTKVENIVPGLMPLWMTEDLSKVTSHPVVASLNDIGWYDLATLYFFKTVPGVLIRLPLGIDKSNCQLPCDIYSTETKLTSSMSSEDGTGFAISFQQDVEV